MVVIRIGDESFLLQAILGVKFNLNDVDLYIGNAQILEKGKLNKYDSQKVTDYIASRMKGRYI